MRLSSSWSTARTASWPGRRAARARRRHPPSARGGAGAAELDGCLVPSQSEAAVAREHGRRPSGRLPAVGPARRAQRASPRPRRDRRRRDIRPPARTSTAGGARRPAIDALCCQRGLPVAPCRALGWGGVDRPRAGARAESAKTRLRGADALPRAARRARIDLLHNTLNTAPAFPGVPQVTTIHDVIYKRFPETAGWLNVGVALLVPLAARRSALILTDSQASRQDIIEFLGVEPARIAVAPLGPGYRARQAAAGGRVTRAS